MVTGGREFYIIGIPELSGFLSEKPEKNIPDACLVLESELENLAFHCTRLFAQFPRICNHNLDISNNIDRQK